MVHTVYRVEHPLLRTGPHNADKHPAFSSLHEDEKSCIWIAAELVTDRHNNEMLYPSMLDHMAFAAMNGGYYREDLVSACVSLSDLGYWFDGLWGHLGDAGFVIAEYKVRSEHLWVEHSRQCFFHRGHAVRVDELPIDN